MKPVDVLADFDDFSGDVAAKDVRQLHAGQSFANPEIEMIQCAGPNANQNLIFARLRIGYVFIGQDFGTAKLMNADCFH